MMSFVSIYHHAALPNCIAPSEIPLSKGLLGPNLAADMSRMSPNIIFNEVNARSLVHTKLYIYHIDFRAKELFLPSYLEVRSAAHRAPEPNVHLVVLDRYSRE